MSDLYTRSDIEQMSPPEISQIVGYEYSELLRAGCTLDDIYEIANGHKKIQDVLEKKADTALSHMEPKRSLASFLYSVMIGIGIIGILIGFLMAVTLFQIPDLLLLSILIVGSFGAIIVVLYTLQAFLKQAFPIADKDRTKYEKPIALTKARWLAWWIYFVLLVVLRPFDMFPTVHNLATARSEIQHSIFGYAGLPPHRPPTMIVEEEASGRQVQRLDFELPLDFVSHVYCYHPDNPNGEAILYHQGHTEIESDLATVNYFVQRGYLTCMLMLPMRGSNTTPPPYQHKGSHEQFRSMPIDAPLQIFIEPIIQTHYWLQHEGYRIAAMFGISGGGWATVMAAAIDTEIPLSVSIAGSLPFPYRDTGYHYEQSLPGISYGYTDLYVLAAENRTYIAIHNDRDSCCFRLSTGDALWIQRVKAVSIENNGIFEVREYVNDDHSILPEMLDWVYTNYMQPQD